LRAYWEKHERGSLPSVIEMTVIVFVQGLIWKELKNLFKQGFWDYMLNMWNLADVFRFVSVGLFQLIFFEKNNYFYLIHS
jgi:hypothetical protein